MADTYEFPPSLSSYRPLQFDRSGLYPSTLRLRHHFFITRVKIIFKEILKVPNTDRVDSYFQEEMVGHPHWYYIQILTKAEKQNVLISQGWCAAVGVPVPTPFFLQEYLLGNYDNPKCSFRHGSSLVKIFLSVEVSDLDRRFHEDIMGDEGRWWLNDSEKPLAFRTLWRMLERRTKEVCNLTNLLIQLITIFSSQMLVCSPRKQRR